MLDRLALRAADVVPALERLLARAVAALWDRGWTPATAVRVVERHQSPAHAALAAWFVLADGQARLRRGEALHPRWEAQLAALGEPAVTLGAPDTPDSPDAPDAFHGPDAPSAPDAPDAERLAAGVALLDLLAGLGEIPATVPRPGAVAPAGGAAVSELDDRLLARVRALLAKAESTGFEEEAEALTAKAQELIARHALDEAVLAATGEAGEPSVRHIFVDDPYLEAKASVLNAVARANRCRIVLCAEFGWVTAFGYDGDLDAVELLGASLLAQATRMMARTGSVRDAAGRSRTRSFRRSFLFGFAHRIGERLREATAAQVATSDTARLLPVLSRRDERLDEVVATTYPQLVRRSGAISNAVGFVTGQAAADLASLDVTAGTLGSAHDGARPSAGAEPAARDGAQPSAGADPAARRRATEREA